MFKQSKRKTTKIPRWTLIYICANRNDICHRFFWFYCRVDANREHNLMTASNLSIVWGASLFTSSVSITNAFETSDLLRRNTLIKVLIQRYDDIFIDTDRLIWRQNIERSICGSAFSLSYIFSCIHHSTRTKIIRYELNLACKDRQVEIDSI